MKSAPRKIITNKGRETFVAFLGTENPHPSTSVQIAPGQRVEIEAAVWDTILMTLSEQGESPATYSLEVNETSGGTPCSVCGGCGMLPGTEPDADVMNTPCPECNPWSKQPCPKCGSAAQVWKNQITGKLTCHRAGCHVVISPNATVHPTGGENLTPKPENE